MQGLCRVASGSELLPGLLLLAGYIPYSGPQSAPLTFTTEFKRPTQLPAKLQAVVDATAKPGQLPVKACVLTSNGEKEVIVGSLSNA